MTNKPSCDIIFDISVNPHFVVDCPDCKFKPGDITKSPIIEEGFLKEAHQRRIEEPYNFSEVSTHLFYLNAMNGLVEEILEQQGKHLECKRCKKLYEVTKKDYDLACEKKGLKAISDNLA